MSSNDIAIRVERLSKCYTLYDAPRERLKQFILPRLQHVMGWQHKNYYREFWALKDISFEVSRGETVGIVGRNGSGKSTLLQLICGTLTPTGGTVETTGRIAALLELGSGFNPEFTGRENVYLSGALLGLTKEEVSARFEAIAAFADIGEFIEQPVRIYSSGMFVRLAFAVIAHVGADVLIVDEALSVGDVFFSQKCMRFLDDFRANGGTLLFVSHDTSAVAKLCRRAILLANGTISDAGPAESICKTYVEELYGERHGKRSDPVGEPKDGGVLSPSEQSLRFSAGQQPPNLILVSPFNADSASFGLGGATIVDAGYFDLEGRRLSELQTEAPVRFSIALLSRKHIRFPAVGLVIKDRLGQAVFTEGTTWAFDGCYGGGELEFLPGDIVRVDFDHKVPILFEGQYAVTVAVAEGYGHDHVQHHLMHEALILQSHGRRLVHGISGLPELTLSIRIKRNSNESKIRSESVTAMP